MFKIKGKHRIVWSSVIILYKIYYSNTLKLSPNIKIKFKIFNILKTNSYVYANQCINIYFYNHFNRSDARPSKSHYSWH